MSRAKILIIEDEEPLIATLKLKLTKEGFDVETVSDGALAFKKVSEVQPELILLDLILPNVQGEEILKQVKEDNSLKHIPIIIISNSGQPVEIKHFLDLGVEDYIIKADFTIDDILERVYNTLEKRGSKPDVLIAEDEAFLRMILAKKLRLAGLKVITTLDGESSLKTILEVKPKVVLLDLLMPGMDGVELLNALKSDSSFKREETKIIVLSNYSGKEEEPVIKELTEDYLIKSNFDIDEVVARIKNLLK